ncbi:class I SAM-dependent methyltransferase [Antarctobacter jejuensis]|uniref:class I SAM-dependent methyltransferase n=1 Tax=Antarctobacter jejuensis TaxID=1439938 RepID=UPI003FD260A0
MSLHATYERQAARYDADRDQSLFERPWLDRVLTDVAPGAAVLDLGCGAGRPIGVFLAGAGFAVTGVDFSAAMLRLYAEAVPNAERVQADMRALALNRQFDAIIGWGSFFHLSEEEQRIALPLIADHLAPGARLLLTVGPEAGEAWGTVGGEAVYHASLSEAEYRAILAAAGVSVEAFAPNDPDCRGHSLLLARRNAA